MIIQTEYNFEERQIKDLKCMKSYLIFDKEVGRNEILIVDINHNGIILGNASNCDELCILRIERHSKVNVISEIEDFDIINIRMNKIK